MTTANDRTDRTPMEGLAEWLRYEAERYDPFNEAVEARAKRLNRWASEVEALKGSAAPATPDAGPMDESNTPRGEWGGLSPKQAWWAGYRVGKGLPPEMRRVDAVAALPECPVCSSTAARAGESQGWKVIAWREAKWDHDMNRFGPWKLRETQPVAPSNDVYKWEPIYTAAPSKEPKNE